MRTSDALRRWALACAWICVALPAHAEGLDDATAFDLDAPLRSLEESGFVVDRTVTNFGAQFVRAFALAWREQPGTQGLDVAIVERPSARWGSVVWIEHKNQGVARLFLYAGRSASIQPLAAQAAAYVARRLVEQNLANAFIKDPDLAGEEL